MKLWIITLAMMLAATAANAAKVMPFSAAQVDALRQQKVTDCNTDARGDQAYARQCTMISLDMIGRWQEKYASNDVSEKVWNDCYESSGAKFSKDVTGWVQCIIRTQ